MIHDIKNPPAKAEAKPEPFDVEALRSKAEHYKYNPDDLRKFLLAACDEIAKLQKRAEDWEQKDVASFEKTIADLREKLTAAEREAAEWAARYGTAEKAERELESYAATDRTASLALIDVTRERDEARERLATAETLAEQRRVELKVHKQFTKQYNAAVERELKDCYTLVPAPLIALKPYIESLKKDAVELSQIKMRKEHWQEDLHRVESERDDLQRQLDEALILIEDTASSHLENDQLQSDLDAANAEHATWRETHERAWKKMVENINAANAKVERLRGLVHREECCEGAWKDSDVDHYGCCEALRCSLGETGGDDDETTK